VDVDTTLKLLDPDYDSGTVRPKRIPQRIHLFRQGELGRLILDALRDADGELGTQEIVSAVLRAGGHGEGARKAMGQRARARQMIGDILSIYAQIFTSLVSARCRTCIKLVNASTRPGEEPSPDDLLVYTLRRDSISQSEEERNDETRLLRKLDKLNENGDFLGLFSPGAGDRGFFFSNDLRSEKGYSSSSFKYRMSDPNRPQPKGWPLWYRSTIVWPGMACPA